MERLNEIIDSYTLYEVLDLRKGLLADPVPVTDAHTPLEAAEKATGSKCYRIISGGGNIIVNAYYYTKYTRRRRVYLYDIQ